MRTVHRQRLEAAALSLNIEFDPVQATDFDLIALILAALVEHIAPKQP